MKIFNFEIPVNWSIVDLPDVVFFQEGPGVRNNQYTSSGVKLLNVANLQEGKIILDNTNRYISEEEAYGKYKHFLVDEGDLIIASSGIKVEYFHKKMGFVKKEHLPLCMNTSTIRFKSLDISILDIRYFMYFLKSNYFKKQLQRLITGSAQLNFGPSHLKQIKVILPDINTQKYIVSLLDKSYELLEKRKAQIEALDQLTQSVFLEMFGDPLGNPKGWQKITFKDYISKVNKINLKNSKNNIKYIDISSIDNNKNKITSYTEYIGIEAPSRAQQVVQKGDILISTVRPNLKNIAMVMDNYDNLICSTGFCVIRCTEKLNNDFIFHLIKTDSFTKNLVKKTTGANYPAVKNSDIYNESIIYPPIDLQEKFSNITKQIEEKKTFLENSLSYQEKLFNSILQKAFNGELFTEEKVSNF
jgi:type I restriction enzyme, S subunit